MRALSPNSSLYRMLTSILANETALGSKAAVKRVKRTIARLSAMLLHQAPFNRVEMYNLYAKEEVEDGSSAATQKKM